MCLNTLYIFRLLYVYLLPANKLASIDNQGCLFSSISVAHFINITFPVTIQFCSSIYREDKDSCFRRHNIPHRANLCTELYRSRIGKCFECCCQHAKDLFHAFSCNFVTHSRYHLVLKYSQHKH